MYLGKVTNQKDGHIAASYRSRDTCQSRQIDTVTYRSANNSETLRPILRIVEYVKYVIQILFDALH